MSNEERNGSDLSGEENTAPFEESTQEVTQATEPWTSGDGEGTFEQEVANNTGTFDGGDASGIESAEQFSNSNVSSGARRDTTTASGSSGSYDDENNNQISSSSSSSSSSNSSIIPRAPSISQETPYRSQSQPKHNHHSRTPTEIMGTPRTPGFSAPRPISGHLSSLPRGDVGRAGSRRGGVPPTPSTPLGFEMDAGHTPASPVIDHENAYGAVQQGSPQQHVDAEGGGGEALAQLDDTRIWGTNINSRTCASAFERFIEEFTINNEFEPHYMRQLEILHRLDRHVLNLSCKHLRSYPPAAELYTQLVDFPQEIIPIMDLVVNELLSRDFGDQYSEGRRAVQVRTYDLAASSRMRDLDPSNIDQLLCIRGMVIRCSPIIPDLKMAFFRCSVCNYRDEVMINQGKIDEPTKCGNCNMQGTMDIVHNRCSFTDKQMIRLQEMSDEVPEGETPYTVTLFAFDDLVDSVRPGDRLEVTGCFRAVTRRVDPKRRTVRSIYKTYVDVIHFRRANSEEDQMKQNTTTDDADGDSTTWSSLQEQQSEDATFSAERIAEFKAFAGEGRCYERLVSSFAPSIWELDDVKRGAICLLVGGSSNLNSSTSNASVNDDRRMLQGSPSREDINDWDAADIDAGAARNAANRDSVKQNQGIAKSHRRCDINILLCGDPGTSKSQLLSYVHSMTPRGIYTSGKGSSAVGLTASVVRDPETRDMVLESGALVLSDNGICCIDEFDKMSDSTRAILHEAMEQQTVSITKAGIIATLNARTSILASANPVESRYNSRMSVVENIKLPPTLLSRFDLIYLILDKPNAEQDRRLARHLVSLYYSDEVAREKRSGVVDQQFLKDYLHYVRHNIQPEISDAAVEVLVRGYISMRSIGGRGSKTISATPRQLESLIRISQALAKMRMDSLVTVDDVNEAIRLMKVATQAAATDPRTGTIDMDLINTGRTALDRDLILKLSEEIRTFLGSHKGQRMTIGQIRQQLQQEQQEQGGQMQISIAEVEEAVRDLETYGVVQLMERTMTVLVR